MDSLLIQSGLSEIQATVYMALIECGEMTPPALAKKACLTRSNAYKVLDTLVDTGVVIKTEKNKKLHFAANNPLALNNLAAQQRNKATEQENAVRKVLPELLKTFRIKTSTVSATTFKGRDEVIAAYRQQINLKEEIYFIRTRADITAMGFDAMHEIRTAPSRYGVKRHVINPDISKVPTSNESIENGSLTRTWLKQEDYTAPVEWSVTDSSLLIVSFDREPQAVLIQDGIISQAFLQLWHLLNACLQAMPYYKELPRS